ncbi:MAG: hypothetical protein K0S44_793 [Bacteroidetes bacterium]|jgi:hypothetical protein|nr:hypothetical protein [Bacteroidota bacterium]
MKTILNVAVVTAGISTALLLSSCGNEAKNEGKNNESNEHSDSTAHSGEHTYACPMHTEVIGKETDKCPKCGMKLEHNDNAGKDNGKTYVMQFSSTPAQLEAGKEGMMSFTPKIKENENEQVPLDVHHEKKIHLIIVSNDLSYFEHIHPEFNSKGNYDIKILAKDKDFTAGNGKNETKFEHGGEYIAFADYNPTGGNHQLEKINLKVDGKTKPVVNYTKENRVSNVDGYKVELVPDDGVFLSGKGIHFDGKLSENGKVIDANTLENYLGAKAHMVVIGAEDKSYLHVHPEIENGNFHLHTTFDKPGIYRGWLQFQTNGKVHTAEFTLKVEEGKADSSEKHSDEHKH